MITETDEMDEFVSTVGTDVDRTPPNIREADRQQNCINTYCRVFPNVARTHVISFVSDYLKRTGNLPCTKAEMESWLNRNGHWKNDY